MSKVEAAFKCFIIAFLSCLIFFINIVSNGAVSYFCFLVSSLWVIVFFEDSPLVDNKYIYLSWLIAILCFYIDKSFLGQLSVAFFTANYLYMFISYFQINKKNRADT